MIPFCKMKSERKTKIMMNKIEKLLVNRGFNLNQLLNDTKEYRIKNLDEAARVIQEAIAQGRVIYVLADYDCDGVMSGCILYTGLTELGAHFIMRFPKKQSEGYGLSEKILPEIPDNALLVTIDNGIAAVEIIEELKNRGIDTVILDHHIIRGDGLVPNAHVLVDPHIEKNEGDFEHYCGAGIGFKLMELLNVSEETKKKANVFAALATIQDIVPLVEDNRNIVREGLRIMNANEVKIPGLYALLNALKLTPTKDLDAAIQEMDVSFQIGPCINAMGRMHDDGAQRVFERLMHYDKFGMDGIFDIIQSNNDRKVLTAEQQTLLDEDAEKNMTKKTTCLVVYLPGLHEGIIGINAARLVEKFNMPAVVLTDSENGMLKGSARSTDDIHMKEVLDGAAEWIYAYGGHAGAAGLTVEKDKLEGFIEAVNNACPKSKANTSTWKYDLEVTETELPALYSQLRRYAPYGEGFPLPVFKVVGYNLVAKYGKKHRFVGTNGVAFNGAKIDGVSFSIKEKYQEMGTPTQMNLIATLGWSSYSKAVQMNVSDIQAVICRNDDDDYLI